MAVFISNEAETDIFTVPRILEPLTNCPDVEDACVQPVESIIL